MNGITLILTEEQAVALECLIEARISKLQSSTYAEFGDEACFEQETEDFLYIWLQLRNAAEIQSIQAV